MNQELKQQLLSSISKNNIIYKDLLNSLPALENEEENELLIELLNEIEKRNSIEALKITLQYWSDLDMFLDEYHGEIYPIIPSLFLNENIPFHNLYYIMESLRDVVSVEEVAIELIEKGEGENLKRALKNLFDMLGQPSGQTYRILSDVAFKSGNQVAIEFFSGLQSYYTNKVSLPEYLIDGEEIFHERDLIDIVKDVYQDIYHSKFPNDDIKIWIDNIISDLRSFGIDSSEDITRKLLYEKLSNMDRDTRFSYLSRFIEKEMNDNVSIFNILGPSNPQINPELSFCRKFGCRMLYCNCMEYHLLDPETEHREECEDPKWFKGECDKCNREIPKRCCAVRKPLEDGGWIGTYCSWNCIYLSLDSSEDKEFIVGYERQMNDWKIINREE